VLSRRIFAKGLGLLLGVPSLSPLIGAAQTRIVPLPNGIGIDPDYERSIPVSRTGQSLGDRPPLNSEERIAKAIITASPAGPTPFDVAHFFLEVSEGNRGSQWQPYAQGWPVRWNPVIVNFFQATKTTPQGDLTSWCAAFVNWCFFRTGKGVATDSASSGSFRSFGTETSKPLPGDIVVFKRTHPDSDTDMHGHVGFFVAFSSDQIIVLGGNQIEKHPQSHKISSKQIAKNGPVLTLQSFRTDSRLHV
jgi:uncharacterized protein (TIGR02594 family)